MTAEEIRRTLRSVRPSVYRITALPDGLGLALVMRASVAGRRNAAERIVSTLSRHGVLFDDDDPVERLTSDDSPVPLRTAGSPE